MKSEKRGAQGYISGVHFQMCSSFSIIFVTLKIITNFFHPQEAEEGQVQGPPKYVPVQKLLQNFFTSKKRERGRCKGPLNMLLSKNYYKIFSPPRSGRRAGARAP